MVLRTLWVFVFLVLFSTSSFAKDDYNEAAKYVIVALAKKEGVDKMAQNNWNKIKTKYELDTYERIGITIGQVGQMIVTKKIIFTYNF